jgi:hypothetical protein
LIAAKEKYNLTPLQGSSLPKPEYNVPEEKGVISVIKHAWAYWFEKNSIPIDGQFRDVKLARKTVKMHNRNHDNRLLNSQNNSNFYENLGYDADETIISLREAMSDEDILAKIIEKTIQKKEKSKVEKEFYISLKPQNEELKWNNYWYSNKGANPPSKGFKMRKPRFLTFKLKKKNKAENERSLLEDSLDTEDPNIDQSIQKSFQNTSKISKQKGSHSPKPSSKHQNPTSLDMIKLICSKYDLSRREVFEIHSQFKAMALPSSPSFSDHPPLWKPSKVQSADPSIGVPLSNCLSCALLHGVHPEVKVRLFKSLGIDTESHNSWVRWEHFVELYWIVEMGKLEKKELVHFWCKFLDPTMLGCVGVKDIKDVLKKLVCGEALEDSDNQGTKLFAKLVVGIFRDRGWLDEINGEEFVNISRVREWFNQGTIDLLIFSNALGNKPLNMELYSS